jgi:RNA recognition motif-containing protein
MPRIYVGNLSFKTTEDALRDAFAQFGEVTNATVISDRETGRSRGFGFIEMEDQAQANAAIEAMNGQELDGRTLTVNEARPREERPRSGGGGGGGGGRGRGGFGGGGGGRDRDSW